MEPKQLFQTPKMINRTQKIYGIGIHVLKYNEWRKKISHSVIPLYKGFNVKFSKNIHIFGSNKSL